MTSTAVRLPRELEKFVATQVEQGTYRSRRAAIVAAVANAKRSWDRYACLFTEPEKEAGVRRKDAAHSRQITRRAR